MIKPHITLIAPGVWECTCGLVSQRGATANQAYDLWLHASLLDAMGNLKQEWESQPAPTPKIPKAGRPITIKPAPKPLPAVKKQPKYHPSVVNVISGTVATREYRTPAALRINELRAEQSEPKLSPLVSKLRYEHRTER